MESLFTTALTNHTAEDEYATDPEDNSQVQTYVCRRTKGGQGVNLARSEAVEADLNRLIERRSSREMDPDER
jgi:hypothetical protein